MIRIVIAEDDPLLRSGLRALVEYDGDIEVVAEADQGGAALARTRELRPDVVLMDLRMPGIDGVVATQLIRDDPALDDVRILVLTTFGEEETVLEALRAGAAGYLLKDVGAAELRQAIRAVAAGQPALSPAALSTVMHVATSHSDADPGIAERLTPREVDVLAEIGTGRSNDEIAERLYSRPATARTYVSRLLPKLEARNRAQLVVMAHRAGVIGGRETGRSDRS